jgi:hypothetical protein
MKKTAVTIELTPEQREKLEKETGKRVSALKLDLEHLEARAAPRVAVN